MPSEYESFNDGRCEWTRSGPSRCKSKATWHRSLSNFERDLCDSHKGIAGPRGDWTPIPVVAPTFERCDWGHATEKQHCSKPATWYRDDFQPSGSLLLCDEHVQNFGGPNQNWQPVMHCFFGSGTASPCQQKVTSAFNNHYFCAEHYKQKLGGTNHVTTATAEHPPAIRQGRKISHMLPDDLPSVGVLSVARQAADNFAASVGEDKANVKLANPQWQNLLTACARVEVHCTAWRAETTLTLADLGIEPESADDARALGTVLQLGRRLLLPKRIVDERQSIDNRLRSALWRRALPSHWGYLVPQQRYAEWKEASEDIRLAYLDFAYAVYEDWDKLMLEVETDYILLGRQNYRRMVAAGRKPEQGEASWVADFKNRCMAKCESKEYWLKSAKMWWDVSYIPLASMLAEDEAEAAHKAAIAQAKTEMEKDVLKGAAKQFEDGLVQFIADVRGELASRVFNVMADVLSALEKNAGEFRFPRNSTKQLKNLVEAVEGLKFWDDKELDEQMATIKRMVDVHAKKRSEKAFGQAIQKIGCEARLLLVELDRPVERQTRSLGIPDEPEDLEQFVKLARHTKWQEFNFEAPNEPLKRQRKHVA